MSYTPINWQTGQTITAEKLNMMDNGWGVSSTQLFSESVTTVNNTGTAWGGFAYTYQITANSINVTFDGADYSVNKFVDAEGNSVYGELNGDVPTFNTYPFFITSTQNDGNMIATQTAGTYTISVSADAVEVSGTFCAAVGKSIVVPTFVEEGIGSGDFTCDMTWPELNTAVTEGRCFFAKYENNIYNILAYDGTSEISFAKTYIESDVTQSIIYYYSDGYIELSKTHYPSN